MERHRIDKAALRETITSFEGLTNEQKADLLQLLSEQKRYGLVWEDHAEDVEEQLRTQLPVLTEDKTKRILSTDKEAPNHILIEGDNLHALTALTYNLISMTQDTGKQGSFDLRVVDDGKKILIIMKDDGKPYNPIIKFNETDSNNAEEANLALIILNGLCPDLNYKYMNGINCVYMNFKYAE